MITGFTFSESTIGGKKYLYHNLSAMPSLPEHRAIIKENADKLHIVPYTHQIPDGAEVACFELGEIHHGLIPLVHVFHSKRRIKMEELILLMHGIAGTIISGVRLGLNENSFVLNPKHIYMKRNSTQPRLIYLPMQVDTPLQAGFSELVEYLQDVHDDTNPLTNQILLALKNVAAEDEINHRDVATIVVQAAHSKTVDQKYLNPQAKKAEQPTPARPAPAPKTGLFNRVFGSAKTVKQEAYEDPFEDFDERTIIDLTDASSIGLNVAVLYEMAGDVRVLQIPITKDSFVIGRNRNEVDHCFDGKNDKGISRIHASIIYDGSNYYVTDKGSSGGTYINGQRLAPGQPQEIKTGDTLQLYTKKLLFECSNA
ncbi:MAG: FHA domain-containing protein [Defluviitaleaceae bacterium]|nr:FHA domain-containing protein [Defluviitaleaceae bacterium]